MVHLHRQILAKSIREVEELRFALKRHGEELSERDKVHMNYALRLFVLVMLDLEYYQPISPRKIIRTFSSFDEIDRLVRLQDHLLRVIRSLEPVDTQTVEEAHLGFILPTLRAWEHKHRIKYFRTINTIAQFLKNVLLKDISDEDNLSEFYSFQSTPKQLDVGLAEAVSSVLPQFQMEENLHWKFGPGASYEVSRFKGQEPKIRLISEKPCSWRTYRLLALMGYRHWTYPEFGDCCSRAIAVPKSIKTKRIITVEPTFNTMATQALRDQLLMYGRKAGLNFDVHSQTTNRMLALAGSATGAFATIDLHAASDSVTIQLVRLLFRDTGLLPYLEDARVNQCEVKGQKVTLQTYAGMGNAVTFPLECIVFSAIVEYVYRSIAPDKPRRYVVYGDDIVVERALYTTVCSYLQRLGFVVNDEKSYNTAHPFRESCGIEALGGFVVTPCRIPRGLYFEKTNRAVPGLLAFSNNLYDCGFGKAASAVRQWFRLKDRRIPYTDSQEDYGMFIWSKPENSHLRSRFNRDLQRTEIQVRDFTLLKSSGSDDCRYQAWLMSRSGPGDKIPVEERKDRLPEIPTRIKIGSPIDRPRMRWIPCPG